MHAFAHDAFTYPPPAGHRFPLARWRLVREAITRRRDGVAANLGGGTHHAFAHSGHGFRNFPFRRIPGDLELELADGTGVPVCVTLAGGYAEDICDTVEINARTIETFAS